MQDGHWLGPGVSKEGTAQHACPSPMEQWLLCVPVCAICAGSSLVLCMAHVGSQRRSIICRVISSAGGSAFGSARGRCRCAGHAGRWPERLSRDLKPLPIIQPWKPLASAAGGGGAMPVPKLHVPAPSAPHGLPRKLTRGVWLDVLPCMLMLSITYVCSSRAGDGDTRPGMVHPPGRRPSPHSHCGMSLQQGQLCPSHAGKGAGACGWTKEHAQDRGSRGATSAPQPLFSMS